MLSMEEYSSRDGLALAELVRRNEVTPAELVTCALRAIETVNPSINAVLQQFPDAAASLTPIAECEAGAARAAFYGVPFLIKELLLHARNVRLDMGSRLARGFVSPEDTELMTRFRRTGLAMVGTTQTPEFGYNPTTECVLHGPVRNPWDLTRSAGGSSGGSGAAVAAGIVPLAYANDGGGSIRIPASCNGLVGLKPSRDRVPTGPDFSDPVCGLAVEFAITRSVRDAAALLDAVAGPDVGAASHPAPPARPFLEEVGAQPGRLRIAWTTTPASGLNIHPQCRRAVEETVLALEQLGHTLIEGGPQYDWEPFVHTLHVCNTTFAAMSVDAISAEMGREPGADNLEAVTLACYEEGKRFKAIDVLNAMAHMNSVSRQVGRFFESVDLFLSPTLAQLPAPLGELNQNRTGMSALDWSYQNFTYNPFNPIFNVTGQPSISLPLHSNESGLPVGVQIAARLGDEAALIRVASQLEESKPWHSKRPRVHAAAHDNGVHR